MDIHISNYIYTSLIFLASHKPVFYMHYIAEILLTLITNQSMYTQYIAIMLFLYCTCRHDNLPVPSLDLDLHFVYMSIFPAV
jgi:hypothetical protein